MRDRTQDLINQLASDDAHIYAAAVRQLLHGGAKAAVALSRVCDSPSVLSRRAADALMKIGRDAVEPLVQVLKTGDREAQVHAINGLLLLNEPSSLEPLIEVLESPFAEVRRAAVSALGMLRDPKAVEPVIRHLQDGDIEVAAGAAGTLGWIRDHRAVAPLLLALENRNWRLRQALWARSATNIRWTQFAVIFSTQSRRCVTLSKARCGLVFEIGVQVNR